MAFDMYAGNRKESIQIHEELLFEILSLHSYPKLNQLWESFYDDPQFDPDASNKIVHEFLQARDQILASPNNQWLEPVIVRLASFFSYAYINSHSVQCKSD